MAFSLRKMLSNITYFTKPEDGSPQSDFEDGEKQCDEMSKPQHESKVKISFERPEPDSTSKHCATSLKLPLSVKKYTEKKASLSDTDVQEVRLETPPAKDRKKCKKLKLNIKNRSDVNFSDSSSSNNIENTPKHMLLDGDDPDLFSERFRGFDFDRSVKLFANMSDDEDNFDLDLESIEKSDHSDTDVSLLSDLGKETIKMCRKVGHESDSMEETQPPSRSHTPDSFGDVELERNEEERMSLLLNYQMKLEKMECFLKKLLKEFQFHIEVSKVFLCKSVVTAAPETDTDLHKTLSKVTYSDNVKCITPESWNMITEMEDIVTKRKVKNQLLTMKKSIEQFVNECLSNDQSKPVIQQRKSITFNIRSRPQKKRISNKKKFKHFDFPDFRDAFLNLFSDEKDISDCESDSSKCDCRCHEHSQSDTDSGLSNKGDRSLSSYSVSTSIGNFTLDSSTLTAYSESLDQTISYNSFQDSSLYSTILQKPAIERITFYVQVHSIQLNCVTSEGDIESKSVITFYCPACKATELEENGLLKHILSQSHCEKIHFLYKTVYIKKCMSSGREIMPSTVLNPMTLYRDVNKVVCFGDAMYACTLCFETLIIGESILMAHIVEPEHIDRRERLCEILD